MADLIAYLLPFEDGHHGHANQAITSPENMSRYIAFCEWTSDSPEHPSRESTAPLELDEDTTGGLTGHGLQLKFSHGPKAGLGFVLGTDSDACDIVLPRLPGISRRHCYLTFDSQRRLILRDCSSNGTTVHYNGSGGNPRHGFTWIVGHTGRHIGHVVLQINKYLKFQIIASQPSSPDMFFAKVDSFLAEISEGSNLPLAALGIQSVVSTVAPSGLNTPREDPILLVERELGRGYSSTVHLVWDVSTGVKYASKKLLNTQGSRWKREALLLRQISHEHIVRLCFEIPAPQPQLILEFLPLGSLREQQSISDDETVQVLVQALSALTYLHERAPSIVHRDIKPENILVQSRVPLLIKLADFGLSKAGHELITFCGSGRYCAPEVFSDQKGDARYTLAVDIWSLGVVVYEYMYKLPANEGLRGLAWGLEIVQALEDIESDAGVNLLSKMIAIDPKQRSSARDCWQLAQELGHFDLISTPTQISHQEVKSQNAHGPPDTAPGPRSNLKRRRSSEDSPCSYEVSLPAPGLLVEDPAKGRRWHEGKTCVDPMPVSSISRIDAFPIQQTLPHTDGSAPVGGSTEVLSHILEEGHIAATSNASSLRVESQRYDEQTTFSEYMRHALQQFNETCGDSQDGQEAKQATPVRCVPLSQSPRAETNLSESDLSFQTCSSGAGEDYPVTFDRFLRSMFSPLS